jgi:FdhD protein
MPAHHHSGLKTCDITRVSGTKAEAVSDVLAVEEPLEIQVACGPASARRRHSIAVTMRTPGHDFDLALGFLFTESIIARAEEVTLMRYIQQTSEETASSNVLLVELRPDVQLNEQLLSRHFYTTSSCGVGLRQGIH